MKLSKSEETNLLQDKLKKNEKKTELISKWAKACQKNTNKRKTKQTKANCKNAEFLSNQKNAKYIAEYIAK